MVLKTNENGSLALIELIKRTGKTQEQFASDVGVTPDALRKYSRGIRQPTVKPFFAMCKELNVSPKVLAESFGLDVTGVPNDE